jgi:hypothetical protein
VAGGQDKSSAGGAKDECISRIPYISESHATYLVLYEVATQEDEKAVKMREEKKKRMRE